MARSRATPTVAPAAMAHVRASGQDVPGAAGLRGGSPPLVVDHVLSRAFLLARAATSPLRMPTTFQPTLATAIVVLPLGAPAVCVPTRGRSNTRQLVLAAVARAASSRSGCL